MVALSWTNSRDQILCVADALATRVDFATGGTPALIHPTLKHEMRKNHRYLHALRHIPTSFQDKWPTIQNQTQSAQQGLKSSRRVGPSSIKCLRLLLGDDKKCRMIDCSCLALEWSRNINFTGFSPHWRQSHPLRFGLSHFRRFPILKAICAIEFRPACGRN